MKNDLTCGVVRDLLPSYVENLLGEESNAAVDRHLETCPDCAARREAMSAPAEAAEETAREVDFLKRVKKRGLKRMLLAALCTAVILLGALGLKVFVIGTPLQPQSVMVTAMELYGGSGLRVSVMSPYSGNAFHGWRVETTEDGITSIYARDVLVSPLFSDGSGEVRVPLEFVREVWLGGTSGRLLWKDGLVISQTTHDLLEAKTPYCGDASALGRIADIMQIERVLGPFSTSLRTSERPYRWDLEFSNTFDNGDLRTLRYYLYQLLALVENLDKVGYVYEPENAAGRTSEDRDRSGSISAENASRRMAAWTEDYNQRHRTDWPVHESVKEYAESPLEYQRMVTILREHFLQ